MASKGLFIGIDRYSSEDISWLTCASRDALALHSLFSDNLNGDFILLQDGNATREAVASQFARLAECSEDDFVFIGFSGHGSETHELVTYDARVDDLANSAIPLTLLLDWFSRIPAKRLVLVLDCCFSGGIGSKVLKVDYAARALGTAEDLLKRLSGEGRLILTASSATEPAWEIGRYGHGLLTYHLIEALTGAEEARDCGKLSVYALLQYVTARVMSSAASIGRVQQPSMRGTMEGAFAWPIFKKGANFGASFPGAVQPPVGPELSSLPSQGFPPEIIERWTASIPSLNQLQIDAINDFGILRGEHLVVSAPTSSGKTMVGELAALKGLMCRKRAIFLLPLKALVSDKHKHFQRVYGPYGLRTIQATGDFNDDVPSLIRGRYDVCLMTYEKFAAIVLAYPHVLEQVGTLVIDEVQMIADPGRGAGLEFILTLVRLRRREGAEPQVIALSAVIGDTNGLEKWLGARLLRRSERPVPLDEGVITASGTFRYVESTTNAEKCAPAFVRQEWRKGSSQDWVIPLVRKLVAEGKQVIVFRQTKGEARGTANYLSEELGLAPAEEALSALPNGDPSVASEALRKCLSGGVAFHISDLDREERSVVEDHFRATESKIRVIAATTTLAMGVNTPAEAVVIVGLDHPGDPPHPYSVAEYKNIVGRAGRLGLSSRGYSFLLALSPKEEFEHWQNYVTARPEDLTSRFLDGATDPRSLIVRVLAAAARTRKDEIVTMRSGDVIGFLECSFGAFQKAQQSPGWRWSEEELLSSLENLRSHGLVERTAADRYRLTELGWLAGQGGVEVESVTRLVAALRELDASWITDPVLIAASQLTVEVDRVLFPVNARGARKEIDSWAGELGAQAMPQCLLGRLRSGAELRDAAARLKKAVACLLWISDTPLSAIEELLTRHGGRFDGVSGPVRSAASRTRDVLAITGRIAEILHPSLQLEDRVAKLLVRLEVGAPSSVFHVARRIGGAFSRSDYHSLIRANLADASALRTASDDAILSALGGDAAKVSLLRAAIEEHFKDAGHIKPSGTLRLPPYEA